MAAAAAASAEVPMPLATPDLLPAKGKEKGRPAMVGADWSSLPYDLVRRIAGSFLATNDVDCYMDLRAVCHHWRSAIDDPRTDASDSRFHPRRWIILDEVFESNTRRLLVNTSTGRFLHKELPLLRNYYVVATTLCGFFVLADRSPPHSAHLFNPLTGAMIRFMAPVPPVGEVAAAVWFGLTAPVPLPKLTLLFDSSRKQYTAFPIDECFTTREHQEDMLAYNFLRMAIRDGFDGDWRTLSKLSEVINSIGVLMEVHHIQPPEKFFSGDPLETGHANDGRCFLMEFGGQLLIIVRLQRLIRVLKFEATSGELQCLKTINNYALFIGHQRCLAICADKFPSVEANCVYYTKHRRSSARIWKYNLKDDKREMISKADEFVKQDKQFVLAADRPFTIIQLLSSYTINVRDSELALQKGT